MFYGNEANKGPYLTDPFWLNEVHVVLRKVSSINTGSLTFWTIQSVSAKKIPIHHPTKLKKNANVCLVVLWLWEKKTT